MQNHNMQHLYNDAANKHLAVKHEGFHGCIVKKITFAIVSEYVKGDKVNRKERII